MRFSTGLIARFLLVTAATAAAGVPAAAGANPADPDLSPGSALGRALRDEGLHHSQAERLASDLSDSIGARLTASPNMAAAYEWAMARLREIGATNVHLEDAGAFGRGWRQDNVWMRMEAPDSQIFVTQAAPWSKGSPGPVEAAAAAADIRDESDFPRFAGTLRDKIVFLGAMRDVPQPIKPFSTRLSGADISDGAATADIRHYFELREQHNADAERRALFQSHLEQFLLHEGVRAVVLPSSDGANGGGTGDLTTDRYGPTGGHPWKADERAGFPILYTAIENFGRVTRLLAHGRPVRIQYDLEVTDTEPAQHVYNVVGDLPGQGGKLARQYVVVGAHLDSWAAGTGATDDGAGVATSLEAVRLLHDVKIPLQRTVRIVLFGGEEEGLIGSQAYVAAHIGTIPHSTSPEQMRLAVECWRDPTGALKKGPDYRRISIAYDIDLGGGRIRALMTGGNVPLAAVFQQWTKAMTDFDLRVLDEPNWPADQSTFSEVGIPGIMFLQDPLDYFSRTHHTNLDTVERLVPEDLAENSVIVATLLARSANAAELLPRTPPHVAAQ